MFIKTAHPKTQILPYKDTMENMFSNNWVAQEKKNGIKIQIHMNQAGKIFVFSRQGMRQKLTFNLENQLLEILKPGTCVEGEWLRTANKIYLFDLVKHESKLLHNKTYRYRYNQLLKISDALDVSVLPIFQDYKQSMKAFLAENSEGLVFKSLDSVGYENSTAMVKCRRKEFKDMSYANRMRDK